MTYVVSVTAQVFTGRHSSSTHSLRPSQLVWGECWVSRTEKNTVVEPVKGDNMNQSLNRAVSNRLMAFVQHIQITRQISHQERQWSTRQMSRKTIKNCKGYISWWEDRGEYSRDHQCLLQAGQRRWSQVNPRVMWSQIQPSLQHKQPRVTRLHVNELVTPLNFPNNIVMGLITEFMH